MRWIPAFHPIRSLTSGVLLALIGASPPAIAQPHWAANASDVIRRTFEVSPPGRLLLDSERGSVEVRADDGRAVRVEIEREAAEGYALDDFTLDFEQEGSEVKVRGAFVNPRRYENDGGNAYRVRYRITVPRRFDATVSTALGSVSVGDLEGDLIVRGASGSLELGRIGGDVSAETSAGGIALASAGGNARMATSAGSIVVGRVGGDLEARATSGNVEVEGVGGALLVSTSAGNVDATLLRAPRQETRVETSVGNITLRVPEGAGLVVDAVARNGWVEVDLPRGDRGYARAPNGSAVHQTVGGGGPTIALRTTQGTITVRPTR
jgi:DUF4097 and DUF4098 domain-containing protein YvlB